MMNNENGCTDREAVKTAVITGASSCASRQCTRSCGACNVSHRIPRPQAFDDRCTITMPGQNIAVPALFKAWIYGEAENAIKEGPRSKLWDLFANKYHPRSGEESHRLPQTKE
jgi:hypothetical protein